MYIAIEGEDEVGKTTLISDMKPILSKITTELELPEIKYIAETEIPTTYFENPLNTQLYSAISYQAQRMRLLENIPQSDIIISDRSAISTLVYQGEYLDQTFLKHLCKFQLPDFVILLRDKNSLNQEVSERYTQVLDDIYGCDWVWIYTKQESTLKYTLEYIVNKLLSENKSSISSKLVKKYCGDD